MKQKIFTVVAIISALVALSSCGLNSPNDVAKKFLKAYYSGNFEKAKKYCTISSREILDLTVEMIDDSEIEEMKKSHPIIKLSELTKEGDTAVVEAVVIVGNSEEPETVELVRVDKKWLVEVSK